MTFFGAHFNFWMPGLDSLQCFIFSRFKGRSTLIMVLISLKIVLWALPWLFLFIINWHILTLTLMQSSPILLITARLILAVLEIGFFLWFLLSYLFILLIWCNFIKILLLIDFLQKDIISIKFIVSCHFNLG